MDITMISTALSAIDNATKIVKCLIDADKKIEKAELRLQLADLMTALAESKEQLANVKIFVLEKNEEIEELKRSLRSQKELIRSGDLYYDKDSTNSATGDPYCPKCYEVDYKAIHLVKYNLKSRPGVGFKCPHCERKYIKT